MPAMRRKYPTPCLQPDNAEAGSDNPHILPKGRSPSSAEDDRVHCLASLPNQTFFSSLSIDMIRIRLSWMQEVLTRDNNFIGDAAIRGHTINSASFFGSANLIVIVGLSGALFVEPNYGAGHGLIAVFAAQDPAWFFQCKVLLVIATLLNGLSDFIWAVRQINYRLAAIGSSPSRQEERDLVAWTRALAHGGGRLLVPRSTALPRGNVCLHGAPDLATVLVSHSQRAEAIRRLLDDERSRR